MTTTPNLQNWVGSRSTWLYNLLWSWCHGCDDVRPWWHARTSCTLRESFHRFNRRLDTYRVDQPGD